MICAMSFRAVRSELLIHVAQVRGKLKKNTGLRHVLDCYLLEGGAGAGLDLASAAKSVISDWTTGKFRYFAQSSIEMP